LTPAYVRKVDRKCERAHSRSWSNPNRRIETRSTQLRRFTRRRVLAAESDNTARHSPSILRLFRCFRCIPIKLSIGSPLPLPQPQRTSSLIKLSAIYENISGPATPCLSGKLPNGSITRLAVSLIRHSRSLIYPIQLQTTQHGLLQGSRNLCRRRQLGHFGRCRGIEHCLAIIGNLLGWVSVALASVCVWERL
jgi:hypothetical protein